jgi:hypothetical protein
MTMPADAPAWLRDVLTELARAQALAEQQLTTLAAAQERSEERFAAVETQLTRLAAAQTASEQRLDQLAAAQARTEDRLDRLAAAQEQTAAQHTERLDRLDTLAAQLVTVQQQMHTRLTGVENRLGDLSGRFWEHDTRDRAAAWLGDLADAVQVLTPAALNSLLDRAVNAGTPTRPEAAAIRRADLVCSGSDPDSGAPLYLVAEISARVDAHDVERAAERAALLARLGTPTLGVVVGQRIDREAQAEADASGVRLVQTGA